MDTQQQQEDMEAIRQRFKECYNHLNAGNVHALSGYYSEDSKHLFPGMKQSFGRKGLEDSQNVYTGKFTETKRLDIHVDQFLTVKADVAILTFGATHLDANEQPLRTFKGLQVWKKTEGLWYQHILVFNASDI